MWHQVRSSARCQHVSVGVVLTLAQKPRCLRAERERTREFWNLQSTEIATRPCTDDVQFNFPPKVAVMKADSAIHLDPSIVCMVDAKSAS